MRASAEFTFAVHPRPPDEDPKLSEAVLDLAPPVGPLPPTTSVDDTSLDDDSFLSNLAFLIRFAFGRY